MCFTIIIILINLCSTKTLMFFTMLRVHIFIYALLGLCNFFFLQILPLTPPPRDQLFRHLKLIVHLYMDDRFFNLFVQHLKEIVF